jgi:hypothetical protein
MAASNNRGAYLAFVGIALGGLATLLIMAGHTALGIATMAIAVVLTAAGAQIDRKSHPPGDKK